MSAGNGTAAPRCCAPDCPSRGFRGEERDENGHVTAADGSTYHFGCYYKLREDRVRSSPLPSLKPAEVATLGTLRVVKSEREQMRDAAEASGA